VRLPNNSVGKPTKDRLVKQGTSALTDYINKNKKPGDTTRTASPAVPATKEEVKAKATIY
jgi:hypothetical protein